VAAVFGPTTTSNNAAMMQNADALAREQLKVTVEITSAAFGTDFALYAPPSSRKTTQSSSLFALKSSSTSSKSDRKNKELALKFEQILSQCVDAKRYPRSEVYVSAATINDDGSASAALFNSIILALVDAGVPLLDVFVAMCATRLDGETLLDQNEVEERGRGAECFVVAETKERKKTDGLKGNIGFNSKNNDDANDDDVKRIVSYDIYGGKLAATAVDGVLRACAKGCDEVATVMRKAMRKRLAKLASTTKNM
jgi:ribonuclease PH